MSNPPHETDPASDAAVAQALGSSTTTIHSGNVVQGGRDVHLSTTVNHGPITNNHYSSLGKLEANQEVIDWLLSDSMAKVNHYARHKETHSKLAPGTGEWILGKPEFDTWLNQDSGTLWGIGIPGAGKTFLASFVIHHLQMLRPLQAVLFAFCRFDDNLSVSQILATLVYHCFINLETARSYVTNKLYRPYKQTKTLPSQLDLETALKDIVGSAGRCFIVVDALDELREDVREELVAILTSFNYSLFVTSREIDLNALGTELKLRISAPDSDFQSIVNQELNLLSNIRSLLCQKPQELSALVEHILSRSNGMLLLAKLYMSELRGITNISNLRKAIGELPTSLPDMYKATLARMRNLTSEQRLLAHRTILWVTHALEDVGVSELLHALAVDPESMEFDKDAVTIESILVTVCCGLITIEEVQYRGATVRFIHYTTYEFFKDHWTSTIITEDQQLVCNAHGYAANICAAYLQSSYFVEWGERSSLAGLYPFAGYASRNLGNHTFLSSQQHRGEIPKKVGQLLRESSLVPLNWKIKFDGYQKDYFDFGTPLHFGALHGLESLVIGWSQGGFSGLSKKGFSPLFFASIMGHAHIIEILLHVDGLNSMTTGNVKTLPGLFSMAHDAKFWRAALHIAAHQGHDTVIRELLRSKNVGANAADSKGRKALHLAAKMGHKSIVKTLLRDDTVDINATDGIGRTALHFASKEGRVSVVQMLLQHNGINVNAANGAGNTAIHFASIQGHKAVVELLLKHEEININAVNKYGNTVLHSALDHGGESIAELLLRQDGINMNLADQNGRTAFHVAAQGGLDFIVSLLLKREPALLNAALEDGRTALQLALENGQALVAELLLQQDDIDVNTQDQDGWTIFHSAAAGGNVSVVEWILQCDPAVLNAAVNNGQTALHLSLINVHFDRHLNNSGNDYFGAVNLKLINELIAFESAFKSIKKNSVPKLLLQNEAVNVNAADKDGYTALHLAVIHNHEFILDLLLKFEGIDVNAVYRDGGPKTALRAALGRRELGRAVESLLQCDGIDFNTADGNGQRALLLALENQDEWVVQLLLQHCMQNSMNINVVDKHGQTALQTALRRGHKSVVELLLNHQGINLRMTYPSSNGGTALHIAVEWSTDSPAIVELILQHDPTIINATNNSGRSALHVASNRPHSAAFELLLEQESIDVNARTGEYGRTALHILSCPSYWDSCYESNLKLLLQHEALDVNVADKDGWTALHHASSNGVVSLVAIELLLQHGINTNAVDKDGRTALDLALKKGHKSVVDLLQRHASVDTNPVDEDEVGKKQWWALKRTSSID